MATTNDLIAEGITSRKIGYWATCGYLKIGNPGSGVYREWPEIEVRVARLMHKLTSAGLLAKAAAEVARQAAEGGAGGVCRVEREPGIWIEVAA